MKEDIEYIIDLNDLKKILPEHAEIKVQRKRGQTKRWYLEIEVNISPSLSEKDHNALVEAIIKLYGEDLIEVYTEETGHWFFVLFKNVSNAPNNSYTTMTTPSPLFAPGEKKL